jgi:hypothetical protein
MLRISRFLFISHAATSMVHLLLFFNPDRMKSLFLIETHRKSFGIWNLDLRDGTAPSVPFIQNTIAVRLLFEGRRLFEAFRMPPRLFVIFHRLLRPSQARAAGNFLTSVCSIHWHSSRASLSIFSVDFPITPHEFS